MINFNRLLSFILCFNILKLNVLLNLLFLFHLAINAIKISRLILLIFLHQLHLFKLILLDTFFLLLLFLFASFNETIALEHTFKKLDLHVITVTVLILVKILEIAFKLLVELLEVFEIVITVRIT